MSESVNSGIIFNIQKFSIHDGQGIRTVIFFMGCPLRCRWCANPESQVSKTQILWDQKQCHRCQSCISHCPAQAITMDGQDIVIHHDQCQGCLTCVDQCPGSALKSEGKKQSLEEVMKVCLQDRMFYEESGGGVTLSGGEALTQPEFASALLKACKEEGIHTAIETTGYVDRQLLDVVRPYVDLFLFDIKHWDAQKHRKGTGVTNEQILANMKYLIAMGHEVLPRLPIIPGFNDSEADAKGFAQRLKEVKANSVQLLPFHQFGEKKYEMLHQSYAYADVPALHETDVKSFQDVLVQAGIHAFF